MSPEPLNRSPDLARLRQEGYFVQVLGGQLLLRDVPYVDENKQVRRGILISALELAGDVTRPPNTHVIHFAGDHPCSPDGAKLPITHENRRVTLGHGIVANYSFSHKPDGGYRDYYEKMTTYASILAGPAATVQPGISPRVFRVPEDEEGDAVFNYADTASARAGISDLSGRLAGEILAIVGLGGTGGYILDFVAKTPVREIRLFDQDEFLNHNAFRAPGAASVDELLTMPKKVDYLTAIYSRMHRNIISHPFNIDEQQLSLLEGVTFAFLCIDGGAAKSVIVGKLEAMNVPFIDVGMGLELTEGSLGGILRTTMSTPEKRDHVRSRMSLADDNEDDLYASNIQVAELNALNASLAVVKWKKLRGFYRDLEREHHSSYTTDGNIIINGVCA